MWSRSWSTGIRLCTRQGSFILRIAFARGYGIHPTNPLDQHFHNVKRQLRLLLNQKNKALLVDWREFAVGFGSDGRASRASIDYRHFTKDFDRFKCADNLVAHEHLDDAFHENVHRISVFPFFENGLAGLKRNEQLRAFEDLQ